MLFICYPIVIAIEEYLIIAFKECDIIFELVNNRIELVVDGVCILFSPDLIRDKRKLNNEHYFEGIVRSLLGQG